MSRNTWLMLSLSILPPALLAADVCLGSVFIPLRSIMDGDSMQAQILLNLRLPKAITAILAGAALSVSGLMMQTLFLGADLLLVCDLLASLSTYPLPISTVSALFGAPIIVWIILKK